MSRNNTESFGLIILGNTGAGKSFICNLLIGEQVFASDFRAEAVTTETRHYRLRCSTFNLMIFDVPGLIEADQDAIDRNKREISQAFRQCPLSIVLFVCTVNRGGRVQQEDIVAFNALNEAYQFPENSLLFMLNNLPPNRPAGYDGKCLLMLSKLIESSAATPEKIFLLENLGGETEEIVDENRLKLFNFLFTAKPQQQKEYREVALRVTEIKMLKDQLQQVLQRMEKDREMFERYMKSMEQEYKAAKEREEQQLKKVMLEMQALKEENQKYLAAKRDAERRYEALSLDMNQLTLEKKRLASDKQNLAVEKQKHETASNMKSGFLGGAATGATVGALGGPIGAAIGALGGALLGGIMRS